MLMWQRLAVWKLIAELRVRKLMQQLPPRKLQLESKLPL
jgi:hypothetical protein